MQEVRFEWKYSQRHWIAAVFLFAAYFIAAVVGRELFTAPAVLYPASGIALAGLFLGGIRLWPVIILASLMSHLLTASPTIATVTLAAAHALQASAGAFVLKRMGVNHLLPSLRDIGIMVTVALCAAAIVPTIGIGMLYLMSHLAGTPLTTTVTWSSWWVGNVTSLLIVAPFIIRWFGQVRFTRSIVEWIEIIASFTTLVVIAVSLFWMQITQLLSISLVYFMLVPLFWIALRLGSRFMTLALVTLTIIALSGLLWGPSLADELGRRLFQTEVFLNIIALIFLIVTALDEERRRATQALETQVKKLQDALSKLSVQDRAKSDFLAILAHELRNPLAPIVSSLEILRLSERNPEERELLDIMDGRVKTVRRLLDDLLDVSRISNEKLQVHKERIELAPVIEAAIASVRESIASKSQQLSLDVPREPLWVEADPVRIEQVVTNLLTNASKFTDPGGRIDVRLRREGKEAEVEVTDTGAGIPWHMLNRIFEPFLQGDVRGKNMGLGIGLSLAKRLTELHDGTISARSDGEGMGSTFIVRLPLTQPGQHKRASEPMMAAPSAAKRVLIVDDNVQAAEGVGKLLSLAGHEVAYAYTGEEAIEKTLAWQPDAVVLDIGLPDMDGYQVAQALRGDVQFTGVLTALTGYGQHEDKQRAYEAGFDYHLVKPVSLAELARALTPVRR